MLEMAEMVVRIIIMTTMTIVLKITITIIPAITLTAMREISLSPECLSVTDSLNPRNVETVFVRRRTRGRLLDQYARVQQPRRH